jgi:hypothetical protein
VFTRALHWSLSWARSIQSIPSHPISLRSILLLSTHLRLGLPSGLYPSGFPTNILYAFLVSPIRPTCSAHLILLDTNYPDIYFLVPHTNTKLDTHNWESGTLNGSRKQRQYTGYT